MIIRAVKANLNIGNLSTRLESRTYNPMIMGLVNKYLSMNWRVFYRETKPDFDAYTGKVFQWLISICANKVAFEDFFV